jgi:hypothetical protein
MDIDYHLVLGYYAISQVEYNVHFFDEMKIRSARWFP